MFDSEQQNAFEELHEMLQKLPDHIILLEGEIKVDLSRISEDALKRHLKINVDNFNAIKAEINTFQTKYDHLGSDIRTLKGFPEIKECFYTLVELKRYQKLVCFRINKEIRKRNSASKQAHVQTFERTFMDRAKAILSPAQFSHIQNEALKELQVKIKKTPSGSVAYEASIARDIEAKRAINRSAIDAANTSRHDDQNDQGSSIHTLIGGLPSLGKRR